MIILIRLKVNYENQEISEFIQKDNHVLILDNNYFFHFFFKFYKLLKNKSKDIKISIGENDLDSKNTILLSLSSFPEILESTTFKKGSLFYEYIISSIRENNSLDNDILLYDIENIVNDIIKRTDLNLEYELENDTEKIILDNVNFIYKDTNIKKILSKLLNSYIETCKNKIFVIFYDSNLIDFKFCDYDNCYTFDISQKSNIEQYNLIIQKELKQFSIYEILKKLENIWPVDFQKEVVERSIREYIIKISHSDSVIAQNEQEYLTYILMNKAYQQNIEIKRNFNTISDNVNSFLQNF